MKDKPENYSVVTYNLKKKGDNQTQLTWTQKGFADEERYKHSESGMEEFLKKNEEIIER
ncbi:MAG: SRPBCC domain-containing protein [Acidobacteriota bacterium]|nr:SRPBCC domain-containing protein [Acidobacteriota bacterium]